VGLTHTSVLDAPVEEVFAWHTRPGALTRLLPPWQPVRVLAEARSVRDGRAVLRLPAGLRWTAEHDPSGYRPPHRFVDQLVGAPLGAVLSWRHTHEFRAEHEGRTRLVDTVDTSVPAPVLRAMFAYRHAQLAADLAAHARARDWAPAPVTVAVTGAGGLVGTAVTALLSTGGHRVLRLVCRPPRSADERRWDLGDPAADLLTGVDAVIHLAGAEISGRFSLARRAAIRDSRIAPTRRLAHCAAAASDGPRVFVSASSIAWYGPDRGDDVLTESAGPGTGFLADTVAEREGATTPAAEAGLRCVHVRTGIVQSPRGGVLQLLRPLFALGLGGRLGDGRQWTSWIGIDDLADIYLRAVLDAELTGPVNAVAPRPVRNLDYTRTLAKLLRRPAVLPVPALAPRLLLGERGAAELALTSQRVVPARLQDAGHPFRHPDLGSALRHLLGRC
jgi:uncharacterized protein